MDPRSPQLGAIDPARERENARAAVHRLSAGPSDEELVQRVLAGDRWAEEAFYRRYVDLVAATAVRLLRNQAEAEDVVQETFVIAFSRMQQLRDAGACRAWLVRVAVSRVHRRFRFSRLRRLLGVRRSDEDDGLADCAAEGASPEARAELLLVDRALSTAKRQDRDAWLLRHAVGCSLEEVASACNCSLAAAKRRIHNADQRIAQHARGEKGP